MDIILFLAVAGIAFLTVRSFVKGFKGDSK